MADGEHSGERRATFKAMVDGAQEDWIAIAMAASQFSMELPKRVIAHLELLKGDCGGFAVDRYEHSLQTATRALRDGRDEEYVVCALIHDIGDTLGPRNHADIGAAMLKPFVSEQNHWMVANHAIFQGYYFFDYLGLDKNMRDQFKGHPWYEYTAQFCHRYDQNSFDQNYDTEPLATFTPMLERVLTTVKNSIYMRADETSVI